MRDAVRAMALLGDLPVTLDVVGDGFDRGACEALSASLGVQDRVTFHGMQSREVVDDFYASADVFLFPTTASPAAMRPSRPCPSGCPWSWQIAVARRPA